MTQLTADELHQELAHFTGTEGYTRHGLMRSLLMTDGVMWLQKNAECYWLVDAIASHMGTNTVLHSEHFQTWDFTRSGADDFAPPDRPHLLTVTDGNDGPPLATQGIEFTTFPLPTMRFFAVYDGGMKAWVLMLPSEY